MLSLSPSFQRGAEAGSAWSCPSRFHAANDSSAGKPCSHYAIAPSECRGCTQGYGPFARRAVRLFPYLGGFAGGQAEYLRVPFADVGPIKIPSGLADDQVLFLSDIFPTGYMAAENCQIEEGDAVAVWGCGPVGQFAIQSARMFGAERVIAIDRVPERLAMAVSQSKAEIINFSKEQVYDRLSR
jgi:threonine dehydrogenase-like Zn-dependent dehydrogenase